MKIKLTTMRHQKIATLRQQSRSLQSQANDMIATLVEGAGGDPSKVLNANIVKESDGNYLEVTFHPVAPVAAAPAPVPAAAPAPVSAAAPAPVSAAPAKK